jgi:tetratricopeptide (TPR) repeat protein
MDSIELLRQALQAARNGRELTARDLFQDVVRLDPGNEVAWMWLSGLLDPLEDRIEACERVLSINPDNQQVRAYKEKLHKEHDIERQKKATELGNHVLRARNYMEKGKHDEALLLVQNIIREDSDNKEAWLLFAELSANIDDKVRAYENVVQSNPVDKEAQETLKRFRFYQRNPTELANYYEEEGELDKALDLYRVLAARAGDSPEFERIYRHIVRLEDAKLENIRYVKPAHTMLRLSIGLPLLYIFEILVQEGLNPIKNPAPDLWIGIPLVIFGSFLVTVAGLRLRHPIWKRWFGDQNEKGSNAARVLVAVAGWVLVLAPHLMLVLNSYLRMQSFQTPEIPWL